MACRRGPGWRSSIGFFGGEPLLARSRKIVPYIVAQGARDGPRFQLQHWYRELAVAIQVKHIEFALCQFDADVLVGRPMTLGGRSPTSDRGYQRPSRGWRRGYGQHSRAARRLSVGGGWDGAIGTCSGTTTRRANCSA
jgi:hypothetical protein